MWAGYPAVQWLATPKGISPPRDGGEACDRSQLLPTPEQGKQPLWDKASLYKRDRLHVNRIGTRLPELGIKSGLQSLLLTKGQAVHNVQERTTSEAIFNSMERKALFTPSPVPQSNLVGGGVWQQLFRQGIDSCKQVLHTMYSLILKFSISWEGTLMPHRALA